MSWRSEDDTVTVTVDGDEVEVDSGSNFEDTIDQLINERNISDAEVDVTFGSGRTERDIGPSQAPNTFEDIQSVTINKVKDGAWE